MSTRPADCWARSLAESSGAGALLKTMRETTDGVRGAEGLERRLHELERAADVEDGDDDGGGRGLPGESGGGGAAGR